MARISQSLWRRVVEASGDAGDGRLASPRLPDFDVSADGTCCPAQASGSGADLSRARRRGADGDCRQKSRRAQARFHLSAARRGACDLEFGSGRPGVPGDHLAGVRRRQSRLTPAATARPRDMLASEVYDVVVIGAGAGGMTAAAVAAAEGLSVLLIEKTEFIGGTTAWSGGMVWIPANVRMKHAGVDDSLSNAADYLAGTVPETENADLRAAFLANGPEAVEYLEANTEVRLQPVKTYPDYYPEKPGATAGGRVLEPVTFDGASLGANFGRLRPPLPEFTVFGGIMVTGSTFRIFASSGAHFARPCARCVLSRNMRCSVFARPGGRRCIWAMRWQRACM